MTTLLPPRLLLALDRFVSAQPFYPCGLLVHTSVAHLSEVADALVVHYRWPTVLLPELMVDRLLPLAVERRSAAARDLVMAKARELRPGPVFFRDTDILFEPSLHLDPVRLLLDASRQARLIATWAGVWSSGVLSYAEPTHSHYRAWRSPELCPECLFVV